ncbi:MAG: hypothetical protein M3365_04660 [Gemmatimonadota bacterium]|nr:hypothetical protein [Gemmatimonadota bacterium]
MKKLLAVSCLAALFAHPALAQDTTSTEPDTAYVNYGDRPLSLPLGIGLRTPSYDRVNGLTLPWGPRLVLGEDRLELDAIVSYRSHLGHWDPSLEGSFRPGYRNELRFFVGRGTFSNDGWIRSDLINSAAVLFAGSDARNHYRADRASLRFTRTFTSSAFTLAPFLGGNIEKGWSTGSLVPDKTPWSVFGRSHRLKMKRPNPAVLKGQISSIIGGIGVDYFRGELDAKLEATVEEALKSPHEECVFPPGGIICNIGEGSFTQATIHSTVVFPTFGAQTFAFRTHAVLTPSDFVPPQRYAYLGGAGTLATVDLLALGGDRLFFAEGEYKVPIERILLPVVGSPFIALRYAAGSAGVRELPSLIQNLGIGVGVSVLRVDYSIDPAGNRSPFSRRSAWSFGVSLPY